MRTPEEMYNEGWCKNCDYDFCKCKQNGKCKGQELFETESRGDDNEKTV